MTKKKRHKAEKHKKARKTKKTVHKTVHKKAHKPKKNTSASKPKKKTTKKRPKSTSKTTPKKKSSKAPKNMAKTQVTHLAKGASSSESKTRKLMKTYDIDSNHIPVTIKIWQEYGKPTYLYEVNVSKISDTTLSILEGIRQELIKEVTLEIADIKDIRKESIVEDKFKETIKLLIDKYFPDVDEESKKTLTSYLIQKSLGMGNVEVLMNDDMLEEIAINGMDEPVWIYHKEYTWCRTNIVVKEEGIIKQYAGMIARKVGRNITALQPLLDAHLTSGDRVNATLHPISTHGNTMTIRKFARDPWTITKFLRANTVSIEAAALIWLAMQYEMSVIVTGGTASGKTSTLNVLASFFPPNQRIISIEDTREISLPKFLHWVPLATRQPNPEGKGMVSMEDLLTNSLRMRPDRVIVGEVRRKFEAETLFEAIHTGHSVYATFHANNAHEVVIRLTNPPIDIPKTMLPSLPMIIVQFRNRRLGFRRTFEIAEILPDSSANVLMRYNSKKDGLVWMNRSKALMTQIKLFSGLTDADIKKDLKDKEKVLQYLIKNDIDSVHDVGEVIAEYYSNKKRLMDLVQKNKKL